MRRYPSCIFERASIDEFYIDITAVANNLLEKQIVLHTNLDIFVQETIEILKTAPTLIGGDDKKEMKLSKDDIRKGHSGTITDIEIQNLHYEIKKN